MCEYLGSDKELGDIILSPQENNTFLKAEECDTGRAGYEISDQDSSSLPFFSSSSPVTGYYRCGEGVEGGMEQTGLWAHGMTGWPCQLLLRYLCSSSDTNFYSIALSID